MQFGHVVGDYHSDQVLLLKIAWGGKSLAVDFRPPSSGGTVGPYYTEMMSIINAFKANPKSYYPAYNNSEDDYEIAGFGWHQGWNDRINVAFNAEYESNMKNFINNVRADLGIPKVPFVIATTGMKGWDETSSKALSLMEAQLAMADASKYPEFEGNVAVVETRGFWRTVAESPANQSYHWNRNAETYFLIGNGMAEEMLDLLIDANAPSVNAGIDMITWSGQAVVLDANIVEKVGSDWTNLTYLWTGEPNGIGDPGLDVVITGADTENVSVTITKTAPTGDATVVRMTLAVNNAGRLEPPVKDIMTIDVYDDGCKAAIGAGLAADNPADFDENCITDFGDLAETAATWLTDHALTEAEPQPTFFLTANAGDVLSSEDWEGAAPDIDDWANTAYDTSSEPRTEILNVPASNPSAAEGSDPTGQCTQIRGDTKKMLTLRNPLALASGGYTSVEISYAIMISTTANDPTLEYSALGDFSDMQVLKLHTPTDNGSGTPYEINRWYAGQTVTLDSDTYTFTDTAKIRLRSGGSQMSHKSYWDDIVITGLGSDPNLPSVDAGDDMISWSGQEVPMDSTIVETPGSDWTNLTYLWTAEPDGIGDPDLDVAITGADTENASVTITKAGPTGDATVIAMTLAVNDAGRVGPPVTDSMTIEVYDDACLAAMAAGPVELDRSDIDENCVTALPDFAVMATTWLDDYTLTEAIPR